MAEGLEVGSEVFEGQVLGETGKTGTRQAHLHIDAVDKNGNQIDLEGKNYGNISSSEFFEKYNWNYKKLKEEQEDNENNK